MNYTQKTLAAVSLAIGCLTTNLVLAYEAGDIRVRAGLARVQPNDDSTPLRLNGTELSQLGLGLPATEVQVDSDTQLGLTLTYMLRDNVGLELLASTPFTHDIQADALGVKAGETTHLPPTLMLQYYLTDPASDLQFYIGAGLNYTIFFEEDVDAELDTALAGLGATGGSDLSLENSLGAAFQIGVDYRINDNWFVNGSVWHIDIDTEAEITTPGLGELNTDVDIDPSVFMLSFGYEL